MIIYVMSNSLFLYIFNVSTYNKFLYVYKITFIQNLKKKDYFIHKIH